MYAFMQAIHQKIQSLAFKDCHAKIRHVDCQETIGNAVVIQVLASVTNMVRTIPRKAPNIQYPIILASSDTNTQYQYRYQCIV